MSHPVTVEPVPVKITNHPEPTRYEKRSAFRSVVLTATNPYQQLVGYDPLRICVRIATGGSGPFIICGSIQQAADPNNIVVPIVAPNGRYIPTGGFIEPVVEGQNEIWVVTNVFPTIIGYEILRKVPE